MRALVRSTSATLRRRGTSAPAPAVAPLRSVYASKIVSGYEADSGITQAAGLVSQWNDKNTTNANNVVQATDANKWAYNASGGPGGLPYLTSFPNASGFKTLIKTSAAGFAVGNRISWGSVMRLTTVGTEEKLFNHTYAAGGDDTRWDVLRASGMIPRLGQTLGTASGAGTVTFDVWRSVICNWNATTGDCDWYEGRVLMGTADTNDTDGTTQQANEIRIGNPSDTANRSNFDLSAHYIFNQPLSSVAERDQWFDYTLEKYGV